MGGYAGDDLTPVLAAPAEPGFGFRQGIVEYWNPDTGHNRVRVGGTVLTDVNMLNTGEAIALRAGHVVMLMKFGSSWFIAARVVAPGSTDFASASVAFGSAYDVATNFSVGTTEAGSVKASDTIQVPAWADEAAIIANLLLVFVNTNPALAHPRGKVVISSDDGTDQTYSGGQAEPSGGYVPFSANLAVVHTNPGSTITVEGAVWEGTGGAADALNTAVVSALAIFRSTV